MAQEVARLRLVYSPETVTEPILYHLAIDFHLIPNIRQANMQTDRGGFLLLELKGESEDLEKGIQFLKGSGVEVSVIGLDAVGGWDV